MSLLVGYWHFEVETDQYDVIWFQKYIATTLRVNNDEISKWFSNSCCRKLSLTFYFYAYLLHRD